MSTFPSQSRDSVEEAIKKAVEQLTAFTLQNDRSSPGSLQKTIDLMSDFIASKFSEKSRVELSQNRKKMEFEVLNAIHVLKSTQPFLKEMLNGTPQQQKLVSLVFATIERYNHVIEQAHKRTSFADRIQTFLKEKNGYMSIKGLAKIHFPKPFTIQREEFSKKYSSEITSPTVSACLQKIFNVSQIVVPLVQHPVLDNPHLSEQGMALLNMKVLSLVEQILSHTEARQALRTAHFQTTLISDSACQITCTLTPFPGQTILVKGIFNQNPVTKKFAIPDLKSFHLTWTSEQRAFPHPIQNTGFALPDLIPDYPHQLEELTLLQPLYNRKQKMAHDLLVNRELIEKAKGWIDLKKEAFECNKELFIDLHRQISLAIISFAEGLNETEREHGKACVEAFFSHLSQIPQAYAYLAETYHIINQSFSVIPLERLKQAWIERGKEDIVPDQIIKKEMDRISDELQMQLRQATTPREKSAIEYILTMGKIIGFSTQNIILQYLSESLMRSLMSLSFRPPRLNDFELKLQTIAYKQLKHFLNELEAPTLPSLEVMGQVLCERLQEDISILTAKSFESIEDIDPEAQIAKELEFYYNDRYHRRKSQLFNPSEGI